MDAVEAEVLARRVHGHRLDRLGLPEIEHVRRVAAAVPAFARVVAWLHDTVEDELVSFSELSAQGLSPVDAAALRLVTRVAADGTYMDYVRAIAAADGEAGVVARQVKFYDLCDNMSRQAPAEMLEMRRPDGRYGRARRIIETALRERNERNESPVTGSQVVLTPVSSEAIPAFASEDEESEFWATHELGADLLERMRPLTADATTPSECPTDELEFARQFIAACRFTYAKSVPEAPHEYCLRKWLPPDAQADYDRFVALIASHGYHGRFLSTDYTYLNVDSWRYWESPGFYEPGVIINRANNERAHGRAAPINGR
jgi:hypothetical protein